MSVAKLAETPPCQSCGSTLTTGRRGMTVCGACGMILALKQRPHQGATCSDPTANADSGRALPNP